MILFNGLELTIPPNSLKITKTIIQDNKTWYTRQLLVNTKEDDKTMGFELTALTGKRHYISFAEIKTINPNIANSTYGNLLQTNISLNGINLDIKNVENIYASYKQNQLEWDLKNLWLQKLQDPELTISEVNDINAFLNAHTFTLSSLSLFGQSLNVFFAKGASCNFSYLLHDNPLWILYTDFTFNLLEWESIQ